MGLRKLWKKLKKGKAQKYGWSGNYQSWSDVLKNANGYDAGVILEITKNALLKVKSGEAVYERDSVLFDKKEYPFPLLSFLLHSALYKRRPLHILDFGGSLGSTYYQVREFLTPEVCSTWSVVEQEHYVAAGNTHFQDQQLKFYSSIEACMQDQQIDFVLLSSSVQYLEQPHAFLDKLTAYNFEFILFDRTAFHHGGNDRLTLQVVPPEIYPASYPSWFFNQEGFLNHFSDQYQLIADFSSYVAGEPILYIDNQPVAYSKGFYLKLKK
ncbi:putative methyltransferase (TIGR04325 family) [Pedobacter africanus]|uniref:Methyltransferase (TIGR04325 family) n=1 Tax=Pedobacter africanus TaxID=151894 RepID=A0ACC6KRY3_9SPHI|nr:TIGR04325 family methyltransferase [Pedobacter africanus]MDR6782113.1 putative methyltransferase (TIGR04325 family) [Pedobacter africanus]